MGAALFRLLRGDAHGQDQARPGGVRSLWRRHEAPAWGLAGAMSMASLKQVVSSEISKFMRPGGDCRQPTD